MSEIVTLPPIAYRMAEGGDINFILNSWMESFRAYSSRRSGKAYWCRMQNLISSLATHARLVLAVDRDDPSFILGWACGEPYGGEFAIYWIYIKKDYRRLGLADTLLNVVGHKQGVRIVTPFWVPSLEALGQKYDLYDDPLIVSMGNSPQELFDEA